MKAYFINLFNYDRYCNLLLVPVIMEAGAPEKPVQLMAHLLAAQQIWLNRCKGFANIAGKPLWPADGRADAFEQIINSNHAEWDTYLNSLDDAGLQDLLTYQSYQGLPFTNTLSDIFTHVINHGTHHRAQIGQHLKLAGVTELPILDYIAFTRL
ncbi:MAG: DinB family protein [Mucilaginibacter sp.]